MAISRRTEARTLTQNELSKIFLSCFLDSLDITTELCNNQIVRGTPIPLILCLVLDNLRKGYPATYLQEHPKRPGLREPGKEAAQNIEPLFFLVSLGNQIRYIDS